MYLVDIFKLSSSISWCESKYKVVPYIAEFWNTLTGICLIVSGVLFYKNNQSWLINSYSNIHFFRITTLLIFVGIGTMLFHSTLYYPFQLLDELPMILLSNEYLVLLMSLETTKRCVLQKHFDRLNNVLYFSYKLIPFIIVSYFINPMLQVVSFHITLKISEIYIVFILYELSKSLNSIVYSQIYVNQSILRKQRQINRSHNILLNKRKSCNNRNEQNIYNESTLLHNVQDNIKQYIKYRAELKYTIKLGLCFYGGSIAIWCIENMFCKYVQSLQLHAFWHLFSSIGIYYLNTIMKIHVIIDNFTFVK
jgi:hypothetical protein